METIVQRQLDDGARGGNVVSHVELSSSFLDHVRLYIDFDSFCGDLLMQLGAAAGRSSGASTCFSRGSCCLFDLRLPFADAVRRCLRGLKLRDKIEAVLFSSGNIALEASAVCAEALRAATELVSEAPRRFTLQVCSSDDTRVAGWIRHRVDACHLTATRGGRAPSCGSSFLCGVAGMAAAHHCSRETAVDRPAVLCSSDPVVVFSSQDLLVNLVAVLLGSEGALRILNAAHLSRRLNLTTPSLLPLWGAAWELCGQFSLGVVKDAEDTLTEMVNRSEGYISGGSLRQTYPREVFDVIGMEPEHVADAVFQLAGHLHVAKPAHAHVQKAPHDVLSPKFRLPAINTLLREGMVVLSSMQCPHAQARLPEWYVARLYATSRALRDVRERAITFIHGESPKESSAAFVMQPASTAAAYDDAVLEVHFPLLKEGNGATRAFGMLSPSTEAVTRGGGSQAAFPFQQLWVLQVANAAEPSGLATTTPRAERVFLSFRHHDAVTRISEPHVRLSVYVLGSLYMANLLKLWEALILLAAVVAGGDHGALRPPALHGLPPLPHETLSCLASVFGIAYAHAVVAHAAIRATDFMWGVEPLPCLSGLSMYGGDTPACHESTPFTDAERGTAADFERLVNLSSAVHLLLQTSARQLVCADAVAALATFERSA